MDKKCKKHCRHTFIFYSYQASDYIKHKYINNGIYRVNKFFHDFKTECPDLF